MSKTDPKEAASENKNNKSAMILIIILAVIVLVLVAVIAFLLGRAGKDNNSGNSSSNEEENRREVAGSVRTVLDESSADDIMQQMREEVAEGMFECQMSMNWSFLNGQAESEDAFVGNSENNTHPICFDVYMKDSEELLYSSPVLPVGAKLTNFKLDKELPAGTYKATVMYHLLKDTESQEEISSAGFVVTIKILN